MIPYEIKNTPPQIDGNIILNDVLDDLGFFNKGNERLNTLSPFVLKLKRLYDGYNKGTTINLDSLSDEQKLLDLTEKTIVKEDTAMLLSLLNILAEDVYTERFDQESNDKVYAYCSELSPSLFQRIDTIIYNPENPNDFSFLPGKRKVMIRRTITVKGKQKSYYAMYERNNDGEYMRFTPSGKNIKEFEEIIKDEKSTPYIKLQTSPKIIINVDKLFIDIPRKELIEYFNKMRFSLGDEVLVVLTGSNYFIKYLLLQNVTNRLIRRVIGEYKYNQRH